MANADDLASALNDQSLGSALASGITAGGNAFQELANFTSVGSETPLVTSTPLVGSSGFSGSTPATSNGANRSTDATNNASNGNAVIAALAADATKLGTALIAADAAKSVTKRNPGSTTTLFIVAGVVAVVGIVLLLRR